MTNDRDPNEKKKLPGWVITLIIIASLIVLIVLYRMIRQLLRMRRRKLSGIEFITVTPQSKARAFKRAQERADRQAQKELNRLKRAQTIQVQNAQNKKTSDFQQKYNSYISNVRAANPGISEFDAYDYAASQRLSELTSKQAFDINQYKQFIKQLPTNIKQKGDTGQRIKAIDRTINDVILKDMNQYLNKATNPTLNGAIEFIEKDSLQNLLKNHSGRSQSSYTQLYRPFYKKALEQTMVQPKYPDPIDYSTVQSNAYLK